MATFDHAPKITLEINRCYDCGRYWALENAVSGTCPKCAQDKIMRLLDDVARHERAVASVRGALTKAKKRR